MTDNQIKSLMTLLERIANALEMQAGMQLKAAGPTEITGHEVAFGGMSNEGQRIAAEVATIMNRSPVEPAIFATTAIPYDSVRKALLHFQDTKGAQAAQNVLKSFGVKYIMELKA